MMKKLAKKKKKNAKCAAFRDRKFCRLFGTCCQFFLAQIASFWKFRLVDRNDSKK